MIDLIFYFGTDVVFVRVTGKDVRFSTSQYGAMGCSIDGLKLNKEGAIREFPDLIDRWDWREEAIKRFKEKISTLNNEDDVANYVISDLKEFGYIPKFKQKAGFRREVL